MLDVLRLQQSVTEHTEFVEAMEMCPLPDSPSSGLNRIGYVHALSGNNMQSNMQFKLVELDSITTIPLKLKESALVHAYVEVPSQMQVALTIKETGGLRTVTGRSVDQDSNV